MADEDLKQAVAALRQQVTALASVAGVLTAALRRAGLMTGELDALLTTGRADAATAQSEQAGAEWERVAAAVQKVAAVAAKADRGGMA